MQNITETSSAYNDLEKMTVAELLGNINREDKTVAWAVEQAIPAIELLVKQLAEKMKQGGRLFYIGAGTSGRLGVVDASECPPTFGVSQGLVIGIMAGGDSAIRKAVEFAEDNDTQAWQDLLAHTPTPLDTVIGIAASGKTPYVIGGLKQARANNMTTGCIVCNPNSPLAAAAEFPIEVVVGAEFVTGSTRMKAGTAQKMVLNMISTSVMILLGKVKGNKMVNMQLTNHKLIHRGVKMLMDELQIDEQEASKLLAEYGQVSKAMEAVKKLEKEQ
jgi:N-acetylmuramic acid 6-phosphate etherase